MAAHVIDHATDSATLADHAGGLRQRFTAWREKRQRRAQIARELLTYTDRELFDLGISRGDIPAIINGTYRRV